MKRMLIVASLLLLGCERHNQNEKSRTAESVQDSAATLFKGQIEEEGSAVFVSRDGSFLGMDSDASLSFETNGQVKLTEYGIAPVYYHGSYTVDPSSLVRLELPSYPSKWPEMKLFIRDQQVLLAREDGQQNFELGGRAAATELADMPPFWPLRMIYHTTRNLIGSVAGLTEDWIGAGNRVVFVPKSSGGELNSSMARLEFLSASTLSYSPEGSAGPTFNGSYSVDHGRIKIELIGDAEPFPELAWFFEDDDFSKIFLGTYRDLHQREFADGSDSKFIGGMPWRMLPLASETE